VADGLAATTAACAGNSHASADSVGHRQAVTAAISGPGGSGRGETWTTIRCYRADRWCTAAAVKGRGGDVL